MSLPIAFNDTIKSYIANYRRTQCIGGKIDFYDGTRPASVSTAVSNQVKVATALFNVTNAGSVTNGIWTIDFVSTDIVCGGTSNTLTWCRAVALDGTTALFDSDVTSTSGAGPFKIDNTATFAGGHIAIISASLTEV